MRMKDISKCRREVGRDRPPEYRVHKRYDEIILTRLMQYLPSYCHHNKEENMGLATHSSPPGQDDRRFPGIWCGCP